MCCHALDLVRSDFSSVDLSGSLQNVLLQSGQYLV